MKGVKDPLTSRDTIVRAAYGVMYEKGYGAASISEILSATNLTKGALYHYFPSKEALGHAVVDIIEADIRAAWLLPIEQQSNPVNAIESVLVAIRMRMTEEEVSLGCPLSNMAQGLSFADRSLQVRIASIYREWVSAVAELIRRGQESNKINKYIDARVVGSHIIAEWTGARGLAKATMERAILDGCTNQLIQYLESLTDLNIVLRTINGHARAERWFAVMAIARDNHDLLWRHLAQLDPAAQRAVEMFHMGPIEEEYSHGATQLSASKMKNGKVENSGTPKTAPIKD